MKKLLALTFVGFAFCLFAFGESKILNVDDAVKIALENNVSIERQKITFDGLKRADSHSWSSVSPSLSFEATYGQIPIDSLSNPKSSKDATLDLSATARISLTANLYTQIQTAKHNYELGKMSFSEAVKSVELSVRQNFYGLLYEKENITLQQKNLEIAKQQFENNKIKYNSGRLSEIDVLSAEVNYKGLIPTVENARTVYENDLANFKQLLGIDIDQPLELLGNLDELIYLDDIYIEESDIKSTAIELLQKRVQVAQLGLLDKRFNAFAPSFSATFNWRDSDIQNNADEYSSNLSFAASIPLDGVLPWSAKNDAIDSSKDNLNDLKLQLKNEKISLKISVDSLLRSIKQSQEAIKYRQANVVLANRTYEMTLEAYNRGTKDLLSLQTANNSLLSAQLALKNEIFTFRKLILNLENKIGADFGTLTTKGSKNE